MATTIADINSVDLAGLAGTVFLWLVLIGVLVVFIGVMAFFVFWLLRLMRFKVNVDIYEHLGTNNHMGSKDVAKEVSEIIEGKRRNFLQLLKKRVKIGPFGSDKFMQFGMRKKINLHLENGIYTPLPLVHNSAAALEFEKGDLLTALQLWDADYAENLETHKWGQPGFWDKYAQYVIPFSMILIMFVLFFILIQQMQSGVSVTAYLDSSQLVGST